MDPTALYLGLAMLAGALLFFFQIRPSDSDHEPEKAAANESVNRERVPDRLHTFDEIAGKTFAEQRATMKLNLKLVRKLRQPADELFWLTQLGNLHSINGRPGDAVPYHQEALDLSRKVGDATYEAASLGNLGADFLRLEQADQAREYLEEALPLARALEERQQELAVLDNLARAYLYLQAFEPAVDCWQQLVAHSRTAGDRQAEGQYQQALGLTHIVAGRLGEAIAAYRQALELFRALGDRGAEGRQLADLGVALYESGDPSGALSALEQALPLLEETDSPEAAGVRAELNALRQRAN